MRARAILARAFGLKAAHLHALQAALGGLERIVGASDDELARCGVPRATRLALTRPDEAAIEADLRWAESSGACLIACTDASYPPLLVQIADPPPMLYVLGDPAVLTSPQLAVVGSRNPTASGYATARDFSMFLARAGMTITSGLALGIDAASHEGALLAGGCTVAVCGTGLDQVYPPDHRVLAERIRERGALVTEFPPRTPPRRDNFPKRNRIISGLAYGTLVVEAAQGSGSLITAHCAADQGREVFAIPGSIHSPLSRGCHQLIREGAKLVERAEDVLSELGNFFQLQLLASSDRTAASGPPLDKAYEMLLDALGFEPASIDDLVARTGLPSETISSMLLILELDGRLASHPGGRYCRIHEPSER